MAAVDHYLGDSGGDRVPFQFLDADGAPEDVSSATEIKIQFRAPFAPPDVYAVELTLTGDRVELQTDGVDGIVDFERLSTDWTVAGTWRIRGERTLPDDDVRHTAEGNWIAGA